MAIPPHRSLRLFGASAAALAVLVAGCSSSSGSPGDGGTVRIGVGGQPLLVYLPTTLAERLGYYRDEGVSVKLEDLQSGSKALQAFQGGSVDVVSGYYDHTIQMQAKKKDDVAFVNMLRYPSLVLAVSPKASRKIDSVADLKGAKVGVTAPGSSTDFFLKHLLTGAGLKDDAASAVTIGGGASAVAAMERGQVDAAVMVDPSVSQLQKRAGADKVKLLTDTRTEQGVQEDYGVSTYPAAVLYSSRDWIEGHEKQTRALAAAIVKALKFIDGHSAQEIAAKMPAQYAGDDPAVYIASIQNAKAAYAKDGAIQPDGADAVYKVLARFVPGVSDAKIDLSRTYTNTYLP
ncbi:ABC transporter substrate-binding protein [Streptomyces sp. 4F14]|uniref:ABC transporter substrate-binding protein n=1 Tax=Streptomyces sp. 4F14 TaxID=3394380 RepID=UPI003A89A3DC